MPNNFVSYTNAIALMTVIGQKLLALNGAYVIKGNSTFENLPSTLTSTMNGYVYNITNDFTTTADFVEGAGKDYPAGTNVVIVNLGDATTPNMKFDVNGSFIDVYNIERDIADVSDMIASEFDDTIDYRMGDLCVYEGALYIFDAAHEAGAWSYSDVSYTKIETLIKNALSGIASPFSSSNDYYPGDFVQYRGKIYQFHARHNAGTPWNAQLVHLAPVADLINLCVSNEVFASTLVNFTSYLFFNPEESYEIGDRVWYETESNRGLQLYEFTDDHTGDWDDDDVSMINLTDLIAEAEPNELTTAQVNTLIGLLD